MKREVEQLRKTVQGWEVNNRERVRRAEAEAEDDNTLAEIARQFMVKYAPE